MAMNACRMPHAALRTRERTRKWTATPPAYHESWTSNVIGELLRWIFDGDTKVRDANVHWSTGWVEVDEDILGLGGVQHDGTNKGYG